MNKKIFIVPILLSAIIFVGCGKKEYKDGVFSAHLSQEKSSEEKIEGLEEERSKTTALGEADVTITIKNGKIIDCKYSAKDSKGQSKDENYGKDGSPLSYKKAQRVVKALSEYGQQLVQKQNIKDVDVITGATISYDEFIEVAKKALEKAEK